MLIPFDYLFRTYHIQAPGVLHLGANTGQEAEAYAKHGVKQVIWVEALPELYHGLVRHVSHIPGSIALCACVSDVNGQKVKFNIANNGGQSSSFLEFGTHTKEHPTVRFVRSVELETIRVDTLLQQHSLAVGPGWFLNADLQGAELLALKGMGDLLWQFDHVYIEVNTRQLYMKCPLVGELDEYLLQYGFVGVETKMTGSGWGDKYYVRKQAI